MTGYYIIKKFHFERKAAYAKFNTTESTCQHHYFFFLNALIVKARFFFLLNNLLHTVKPGGIQLVSLLVSKCRINKIHSGILYQVPLYLFPKHRFELAGEMFSLYLPSKYCWDYCSSHFSEWLKETISERMERV